MKSFNDRAVLDMPSAIAETTFYREFSDAQYNALQLGLYPEGTDDRWFVYMKNDWLYVHRSWTGHCIFKLKIAGTDDVYKSTLLQVNRDSNQYRSTDIGADIAELNSVLDTKLASV